MKKKMVLLSILAGTGTLLSGCWSTLHDVAIHGADIIQTWGAMNQLGFV